MDLMAYNALIFIMDLMAYNALIFIMDLMAYNKQHIWSLPLWIEVFESVVTVM